MWGCTIHVGGVHGGGGVQHVGGHGGRLLS